MRRKFARKALLGAVWTLYVLGLLELTGFIYFRFESNKPVGSYGYPEGLFVAREGVEYGLLPMFRGHFVGDPYSGVPIEINSAGYRDAGFGPKASGTVRIAVVGDSVVFGSGVRAEERFTDLLRHAVLPGGQALELLNLGVSSYSFPNYIALVERYLDDLHPDAVVVGFTLNDYESLKLSWPRRLVRKPETPADQLPFGKRVGRLIRDSNGRRFLREMRDKAVSAAAQLFAHEPYHTQWMRNVIEKWAEPGTQERVKREMLQLQEILAHKKLKVLYLLFPELDDASHPGQFDRPRQTVLRLLGELKLPVCDPYARFAEVADPAALFLAGDSVHFTPAGHRIVADALAACLRSAPLAAGSDAPTATPPR